MKKHLTIAGIGIVVLVLVLIWQHFAQTQNISNKSNTVQYVENNISENHQGNVDEINSHNEESITKENDQEILSKNRLRTDIQKMYPDDIKKQEVAYFFAKELESILNDEVNINDFLRAADCMAFNMLGSDIGLIENLVFDTNEKREKYIDFNSSQSGGFFGGDLENLDCTYDE